MLSCHHQEILEMRVFVLLSKFFLLSLFQSFVHAQCVFNGTHCTCALAPFVGLCSRFSSGTPTTATCVVDDCEASSRTCDCNGTELCTINNCDAWKPSDPNQALVLGETISCFFRTEGVSCISVPESGLSQSSNSPPSSSPEASSSVSSIPTSSPTAAPSSSSSPSPSPSPIRFICPDGNPILDLHNLFPTGFSFPASNFTFSTTYDSGQTLSARPLEVSNCNSNQVQALDDYISIGIHPTVPDNPNFPGYCVLQGPNKNSLTFDSHVAMVFQSEGFNFQPTALKIWDIDNVEVHDPNNSLAVINGVHASESVAVFGARDGNFVLPSTSLDAGTALEELSYAIPAESMVAMGLPLPSVVAPGAQQQDGNSANVCDHVTDRITCAITFSFSEPIDTMVVVYGFDEMFWAGESDAKIFMQNPTVGCPP